MPNDNPITVLEQGQMMQPHLVTSHDVHLDADYRLWLQQLKERYRQAQIKAASRVNEELLRYYWLLGADIDSRGDENRYGTRFYKMLSRDLQQLMPEEEGFSESNLKFAVRFYRMYSVATSENREQVVNESAKTRYRSCSRYSQRPLQPPLSSTLRELSGARPSACARAKYCPVSP